MDLVKEAIKFSFRLLFEVLTMGFRLISDFLAKEILNACRSVRASHILIGGNGNVCLSGLRKVYHMFHHGKKWTQVHNYPEACSADLQWLSPEILEQVETSQSHTLNRIIKSMNSLIHIPYMYCEFIIFHWTLVILISFVDFVTCIELMYKTICSLKFWNLSNFMSRTTVDKFTHPQNNIFF